MTEETKMCSISIVVANLAIDALAELPAKRSYNAITEISKAVIEANNREREGNVDAKTD